MHYLTATKVTTHRVVQGLWMDRMGVWKQVVFRVYFSTETSHRWIEEHVIELTLTVHGETGKARRISGSAVTGCREFTVKSRTAESMLGTKRKSALLSQLNSRPLCSQLFTVTVSCNAAPWRKNWVLKQTLHYFKPKTERRRNAWLIISVCCKVFIDCLHSL